MQRIVASLDAARVKALLTNLSAGACAMRPLAIAFLAENPALSALLGKGLEEAGCRVAVFSDPDSFRTYLRIAPVDLVVLDADSHGFAAPEFAWSLRTHPKLISQHFLVVALTRAEPTFHSQLRAGGVDLVLGKPIGATQLLLAAEEVDRRVGSSSRDYRQSAQPVAARRALAVSPPASPARAVLDNVIPLFASGRRPR
jgi:DNA-binding response OmpR family regulator